MEAPFGVTTPGFTPNPGLSANNTITWPRDPAAIDVAFAVQTSTTLEEGGWTDVPLEELDLSEPDAISHTLPAPDAENPRVFVRIRVTQE